MNLCSDRRGSRPGAASRAGFPPDPAPPSGQRQHAPSVGAPSRCQTPSCRLRPRVIAQQSGVRDLRQRRIGGRVRDRRSTPDKATSGAEPVPSTSEAVSAVATLRDRQPAPGPGDGLLEQRTDADREQFLDGVGSRRTTASRAARCGVTLIASVMVMTAGRPSGIAATAMPTAAMNISATGRPRSQTPKAKADAASTRMAPVSRRPKTVHLRQTAASPASRHRRACVLMRPSSVAVAGGDHDAGRRCRRDTSVPEHASDGAVAERARRRPPARSTSRTGTDSPVSAASSICRLRALDQAEVGGGPGRRTPDEPDRRAPNLPPGSSCACRRAPRRR